MPTVQEILDAFAYLIEEEGLVAPHNTIPAFGENGLVSEAHWNAVPWNPEFPDFQAVDPDASAKPTYQALTAAIPKAKLWQRRLSLVRGVTEQEALRICTKYLGTNHILRIQDEVLYRLRCLEGGVDISAKHTKRNHLHAKVVALTAWINHADRTLAELEAFDPTDDANWSADDAQQDP